MSLDAIPELDPEEIYELCPDCEDSGVGGCMTCWDEGLVVHRCDGGDGDAR